MESKESAKLQLSEQLWPRSRRAIAVLFSIQNESCGIPEWQISEKLYLNIHGIKLKNSHMQGSG